MKNASLNTIYATLSAINFDNEEIMEELRKEMNRGSERKAANAKAYDALHDAIVGNLDSTPVTCAELFAAIEHQLPEGVSKSKVQYALTHLWQDEIVKVEGKPNTYHRA